MKRITPLILSCIVPLTAVVAVARQPKVATQKYRGWSAYGGGPEQMRYSGLTQINRANVAQLERVWTYDSGESGGLQTQPIVADGVLYAYTPTQKTFALRADTGEQLLDLNLYMSQMGPPISFTIEGKQYISVAGGPAGGGGFGGGAAPAPGAAAGAAKGGDAKGPAPAPRPAHLLLLTLDGKAPIPGAPAN